MNRRERRKLQKQGVQVPKDPSINIKLSDLGRGIMTPAMESAMMHEINQQCLEADLSLDINELVRLVKRAAVEAVQAGAPMSGGYGYVTSTSPLEITVDQKKILTEAQLILTDAVRDYTVEMTTMPEYHETEETSGGAGDASFAPHKHRYQGRKKWKVHNALQMGEKVILLRCDGGQQYIVLGRWEART